VLGEVTASGFEFSSTVVWLIEKVVKIFMWLLKCIFLTIRESKAEL
jgi:hypothetical protein